MCYGIGYVTFVGLKKERECGAARKEEKENDRILS